MSDTKIDEPHSAYKRLKEDQPDPVMAYSGSNTAFINPNAMAYPNPNEMPHPNPNANAMAYPNAYAMPYPNPNAMAYPNANSMSYPNPNDMAYPNTNTTAQQSDSNAMASPSSKYAMAYPQGTEYSTAPDSDTLIHNEPPKPSDNATDFEVNGFDFSVAIIRKMFIRKVYAVLMCQLLLTVAITAFFMYCKPIRQYMMQTENSIPVYMSMFVVSLVLIVIMICTDLRRVAPWNFVFLALFTVTQGVIVGILGVYVESDEMLLAFGITAVVVLSLTLFAFQTKWDFTSIGGGLLATLVVLIIFGSLAAFVPHYRSLRLLYCGAGVILFSFYIIYDTQLMIGGGHKYTISPEEYIFAALTLYLDILNLFIYILRLMRS